MSSNPTLSLDEVLKTAQGSLLNQFSENPNFSGVAPLEYATKETISFLTNIKYISSACASKAGIILCTKEFVSDLKENSSSILVICPNPYAAFAKISQVFFKPTHGFQGISQSAHIDKTAKLAETVTVFPGAYIASNAIIGERTVIYPGCFIGENTSIGEDCILYPNVVIREGCRIGSRCLFNPGVVIGGDGFGFAPTPEENIKIPQIGGVQIADDVECGSNSAIDRGTVQDTCVGRQTKIDNLVQIGHNTTIGEFCFLAGQTGVAGSAKIGHRVTAGGQVGISGHLSIGDHATVGSQAGVSKSIPKGQIWWGTPARPLKEHVKSLVVLSRLAKKQR